ncbi:MAG TPA: hypothetical protein PLU53_15230, partial [Bacteroidia bacterium]|nr:hypothetical protein [Bacteroidia bacterium]
MEVQSSSQPEVRDANLSQQAKYDDGVRHENNLVAGKTEKETKDSEQAKKTENAEIALAGNTEQKSEPQVVVPFPAEGASPSDQVVKTVVRNNEEKNSKGMDSGKPDGSETVPSIAGESEHEGHSQNAAIPNNAKSGTTLSGQDEKKAVKSRESLDSETGSTNELAGKQKNDSEPSPVNIDPALSVNSGKPVGNKPGKPDSKNEVKESITTVPSVSGKETKNDSGGDSGNTESSTKTNPSNTSGTGNSTSTESAATPVRTTNIPVSKQASQQNSSVQNITEIPTVPQEALVAYKGYENKLTQSRVLAGQSERLQERVASMKISPVRDSLIEVSNSLSRESIKDWQDAQRQLADAKRIDPEIEVKVKEFTSQEPRLAVVSPASGDERSVPEGTAKSNEIATTENSGKEKKVSTTKDQYIPEKNVKTPPRSVEIQPEVQGTLAVDNPLVTQNRQTDADKNTNSPLSSTATQQEKKTEVKDDLIISEPTTIINTETKKEEDLKPKLTGTHDQVIAQKTAETSLNQNDGVLKTENQVSKGGITSKTENQTAAVKTTDTVDGNTFAGRKDSAPTDKVDQKNMTVVEETGVKNEAKTEQKSAESNSIPIPAQSELPEIVKDNSASTELLSKETGTTQPNSKSPTREQVSTTRKVSDQNQSAPSGAVPVQNTSGIENNAFPSETKTITGIQHPDAISEPGQSGVSAAEKDVAVTGKSPEAGNVRDQVMNERRSDSTEKNVALPGNSGKTPAIVTEGTSGNQQNNLSAVAAEKSIAMNNTVRKTDQHNPEGQAGNQPESNAGEVTTGNSNVQPAPASEQLDTTREEYPRYVKIQKDINTAQVETITIFASAVNMNKLAVEEKQKQLDLLDEADKTTDENKKIKLIKEAEKLGKSSRKNEMLSRQKFTEAQQKTSDVKVLTW